MPTILQKIFPATLRFRVTLMVSLTLMGLVALYTYHNTKSYTQNTIHIVQKQAENITDAIVNASKHLIIGSDVSRLTNFIVNYSQHPEIISIQVYNNTNRLLVNSSAKEKLVRIPTIPQININTSFITIWKPVYQGRIIGWVKLKYGLGEINQKNNDIWMSNIRNGFIVTLLVGLVPLIVLRKPLDAINSAANFVANLDKSQGDLFVLNTDYSELNKLLHSINSVSEKLYDQDKTIKSTLLKLEMLTYATDQHSIVSITDAEGKIFYVNEKFCQLSQYSSDELCGNDHSIIKSGYHSKIFYNDLWRTIKNGNVWSGEINNKRKDGSIFWVDTTIVPFFDETGELVKFITIRTDISNQKAYETKLSELAEFPEKNPNLILSANVEKGLIYTNPEMKKVLDRLLEKSIDLNKLLPDNFIDIVSECLSTGQKSYSYEVSVLNNTWLWNFSPILGQNIVHGYGTEITQRKRAEKELINKHYDLARLKSHLEDLVLERTEELETANENLIKADRVKNEFLATVSHELRTPLTSIKSFAEILKDDLEEIDIETQKKYLGIIDTESDRLSRIISDILDFQKLDESEFVWRDEAVNPITIIQSCVETFSGAFQEKGIKLIAEQSNNIAEIFVDTDKMKQVIINFLSNALKFTRKGTVTIGIQEKIDGDQKTVCIYINDTGIGIEPDKTETIFERFKQIDSSSTREYGGSGLGLTISKEIVCHYNGKITVQSAVGKGTIFLIELPTYNATNNATKKVRRESA